MAATSLRNLPAGGNQVDTGPLRRVPPALFGWLQVLDVVGLVVYVVQLGVTYAGVRLDYELRWYIVTDRSPRIRSGVWNVQETTMSFCTPESLRAWRTWSRFAT